MAMQQGRMLEPELLLSPPSRLSRTTAAGKGRGRKMVVKDADGLVGMGKRGCREGRARGGVQH